MLLSEFLQNPSGKSSAMFYNRKLAIQEMNRKLDNYIKTLDSKGKKIFRVDIFRNVQEGSFIFKFLLPSEKYKDLAYDVFIKFTPPNDKSATLENFSISFFSNSPAFTFTYTYVLNKRGLLFNDLNKCNRKALSNPPVERNPVEILGFEKSIYACGLFIRRNRDTLMNVEYLKKNSSVWTPRKIAAIIPSDEDKLDEYNKKKKMNVAANKRKRAQDAAKKRVKNNTINKRNKARIDELNKKKK